MFGHHRNTDGTPGEPETKIGESHTDEDIDVELADLEDDLCE